MKKLGSLVVAASAVALVVAALAPAAARDTYTVSAALSGGKEVPKPKGVPAGATGSFSGKYVENKSGATLTWKLTFSHLSGKVLAAHIHGGKPGVAGAVLVPLCGPCRSGQTGTAHITKAVITALEGGKAYVNVHTPKNQAGEIRGQVATKG